MSINTGRFLSLIAILLTGFPALAENGVGIIEDPITRKRHGQVTQDWQEGIVLQQETGNYLITYKNDSGSFSQIVFEPANKVAPRLTLKLSRRSNTNIIRYEYRLENGRQARQPIMQLISYTTSIVPGSPIAPKDWFGVAIPDGMHPGLRLSWSYVGADILSGGASGLRPGGVVEGFVVESNDLAGIAPVEIWGHAKSPTWLGLYDVSSDIGKKIEELKKHNAATGIIAVPKIPNPVPYGAVTVLTGIQKHLDTDLVTMKLVDPALITELDRWLGAAISAAGQGNTKALRASLQEARKLLLQEHQDLDKEDDNEEDNKPTQTKPRIDRLAARVLDFDLRYVESRIKGEGD